MHHGIFADCNAGANHGAMDFPIDFRPFPDNAPLCHGILCNILGLNGIAFGVNLPVFLIQVEFWDQINQLHIGFPIRAKGPHVLPVAVVLIREKTAAVLPAVWDNMLAEITVALLRHCDQGFLEHAPVKNVDAHGRQVAPGVLRLLLKL